MQCTHQQGIAKGLLDDAHDAADMLCRILEEHQVHACLALHVVVRQVVFDGLQQAPLICHLLILLIDPTLYQEEKLC